ncbi:MAG: flagellar basal-body rod protein FlgF [Burkholderiaceae bacterium]|nr:flagellar basal-body rod protein FlgF [Burkholderiaceae bacterium]
MDRLIYTAMTGAKHTMEQQATTSNNLANATTTGFRAQLDAFRSVPLTGDGGLPTRSFVVDATVGADFTPGPIQQTGRDLDVAVQGSGWLALQTDDGSEAYTRNGALTVSQNGILQTQNGVAVAGQNGPISIPPNMAVTIGADGTVSTTDHTTVPAQTSIIGQLKLVNPPTQNLVRGDDGLFRTKDASAVDADPNVIVAGGALEGSNVNVIDSMVNMISLSRQFDLHMSMLKTAETNETSAEQILSIT